MRSLVPWNHVSRDLPGRALYHSGPWSTQGIVPALDLYRTPEALVAQLAVPGVKLEDLEVTLTENVLLIKGKSERQEQVEEGAFMHRERSFGSFSRSIALPDDLDLGRVTAEFENGVLTLTVPRAEEAKRKSVQVKVK